MATLEQLLKKADMLIEKRAEAAAVIAQNDSVDAQDDIFALAEQVRDYSPEVPPKGDVTTTDKLASVELSEMEKLALDMALTEVLLSAPELTKLAEFEEAAIAKGATPEQMQKVFDEVSVKTGAGGRVLNFMTGVGESLQSHTDTAANVLKSTSKSHAAGRAAGAVIPAAVLVAGGAHLGSKHKEYKIKKQMGLV